MERCDHTVGSKPNRIFHLRRSDLQSKADFFLVCWSLLPSVCRCEHATVQLEGIGCVWNWVLRTLSLVSSCYCFRKGIEIASTDLGFTV